MKEQKKNPKLLMLLREKTAELEKQRNHALQLAQAKALFLSKATHEFRTPLTAISGYCELIEDHLKEGQFEARKYLSIIERNARGLLEIIDDIIDMVRLEQDSYILRKSSVDLRSLIEEITETCSIFAREKGLELKLFIPKTFPKKIMTDPMANKRVLTNLIGNAMKYTRKGCITIEVKVGKMMTLSVRDTGPGISEDQRKLIFRPFYQAMEHQVSTGHRSSGLGLAICKHLAKLMGGDVRLAKSEVNKGSTFVYTLPLK